MCKAAADRPAVADLVMRHVRDGCDEQRVCMTQDFVALDVAPSHHRTKTYAIGTNPNPVEFCDLAQVDEERGRGKAERENGNQALASGDRLRRA